MIKTQIQLSEELYHQLKRFSKAREWSLAETFRRGAELILEVYPGSSLPAEEWSPPRSSEVGWQGLAAEELRDLAFQDAEPDLAGNR